MPLVFVVGRVVHEAGPILAGQNLVHSNKGVVDVREGDTDGFVARVVRGEFPAEHLDGEDRCEKSDKEHEDDEVEKTIYVPENDLLYFDLV